MSARRFTSDVAFSPAVKAVQERLGSRAAYARVEEKGGWRDRVTPDLEAFLAERDSFYLASASADGQPYIQHRGGPKGFLRVLDERTLGFADFGGNRQYVTVGNLTENDRVCLFLMDYAHRRRIKLWGRMAVLERGDDAELEARLIEPEYKASVERLFTVGVEAWDVNCSKHITRRFTEDDVAHATGALLRRIAELEQEVARLRAGA